MLQAFKNDTSIKQQVVSRIEQHIKLHQVVQGKGYDSKTGEGCAVGCAIDCYDHQSFADILDVDIWIPQIYDTLHEGVSDEDFEKFDIDFIKSLKVGMTSKQSDLVKLQLFYFMLTEIIPSKFQEHKEIAAIIKLFKLSIKGVTVTKEQWIKIASTIPRDYKFFPAYSSSIASSDAYSAAYFAAYSDASSATSSAAYSVSSTSKLKQEAMLKIGYKLIELFNDVKVKECPAK